MNNTNDYDYMISDHGADIALEAQGTSLEWLFTHSIQGLLALIGIKKQPLPSTHYKAPLVFEIADINDLLIIVLNEVIYTFFVKRKYILDAQIIRIKTINNTYALSGYLYISPRFHTYNTAIREIKAATYSDLRIIKTDTLWKVKIIFDV